ncbi:MAG: methyltransferase domain-containing protein, partial [Victivallales bacterium]
MMIEMDTPEVNTEEIMARIREEVQKYNDRDFSGPDNQKALFPPCPMFSDSDTVSCAPPLPHKEIYAVSDFPVYHDSDFIDNAYAAILRREADPRGKKFYLSKLRNGTLTKTDILGRLRYSGEGRNKRVVVKGLLRSFIVQSLFKLPVLGWGLRILAGVLNLPTILKNIQAIECAVFVQKQLAEEQAEKAGVRLVELRDHVAGLQEEIDRVLADQMREMGEITGRIDKKADRDALTEILRQIKDHKLSILDMQRRVQLLLEEARKRFPEPMSDRQLAAFADEADHLFDAMYVNFEDRFRGAREDIKDRVKVYLPYVRQAVEATGNLPVLDVGCGRGEWLELLGENDIEARGLDLNRVMVSECRELGLDAREADVIDHLKGLKAGCLSVISGFHIVEHLPLKTVIALFDEALRVLKPGGIVIFETPNPENLLVGACGFYTDPTHKRPIPPVTLSYLVEARGFMNVEVLRLNQNPSIHIEDPFLNEQF